MVVGRIGGYNRGESVQEDADLKTAVAGENLWDDYGIFFLFFFFSFFFADMSLVLFFREAYEPEIGNQPRAV